MTLHDILNEYRSAALSEREKGTYFEELILSYLRNEASYRDLYRQVWTYADWAAAQGLDKRDTGIDLVAQTAGTGEFHAIQCKLFAADYRLQKADIDSFFTASGKRAFHPSRDRQLDPSLERARRRSAARPAKCETTCGTLRSPRPRCTCTPTTPGEPSRWPIGSQLRRSL